MIGLFWANCVGFGPETTGVGRFGILIFWPYLPEGFLRGESTPLCAQTRRKCSATLMPFQTEN